MANTYTQIHIQFVFAVKFRDGLIHASFKEELFQYISGILNVHHHKLLAINSMPDHIHIFIGMRPTQSVSDLMQEIKANSSRWINERKFLKVKFEWQEGYGAFSYSKSQVHQVIDYIIHQERHHQKQSFKDEYVQFLHLFAIDYDERYVFKDLI
mgnify:FL=1